MNFLCKICNQNFNYSCGSFTIHLLKDHKISRKDYFIKIDYNGIPPKCQCGYCQDDAVFIDRKNKFFKINPKHRDFNWLKEQYIKKYGEPKCKCGCGNLVKIYRGKPLKYYSYKCLPNNWNQDKIKETYFEKYEVDHPMKLNEVKDKIKETCFEKYGVDHHMKLNEVKDKIKETYFEKYGVDHPMKLNEVKDKIRRTMIRKYGYDHISKTKEFRENASKRMTENNPFLKNGFKSKKFNNGNLYYQSSYELDFLHFCESNGIINLIENGGVYRILEQDRLYGNRTLTDFKINDIEIEIKSSYILKKQGGIDVLNAKKRAVESTGKKYLFILDKNYLELEKIIQYLK